MDKVAPVVSKVEQQPDSGHTEMTLAVTATDADRGVKGYAVTLSLIHIFSAVTVTAGEDEIELLVGGTPREYDLSLIHI